MMIYPKDESLSAGSWYAWKVPAGWSVMFKCPMGHIGLLSDHNIAEDGTVTPSVVCPQDDCDFHDHIKLENWTPL